MFTQPKYISLKFCQFVASLYFTHITNYGRFSLIFSKMALIFLRVLRPIVLPFQVSSFTTDVISSPKMGGPQFIRPQSTGLSGLGAMLDSCHRQQPLPKTVAEFKDALQSVWSASPEKVIDNAVNNYCKRLQARVSANDGYFENIM